VKFPASADELKANGYDYDNDSHCRACGAAIEWWITPNGKKMPMVVEATATIHKASGDIRKPHWADCPNANEFRRAK
jgi:hypothetical protein